MSQIWTFDISESVYTERENLFNRQDLQQGPNPAKYMMEISRVYKNIDAKMGLEKLAGDLF